MESGFRDSVVSVDVTLGVAGLEEEIVTADEVVVTANTLLYTLLCGLLSCFYPLGTQYFLKRHVKVLGYFPMIV